MHYAEIKDDGSTNKFKMLYEGDRVEYTPASSGKGTQAKDVVKLSSVKPAPSEQHARKGCALKALTVSTVGAFHAQSAIAADGVGTRRREC